MWEVRTLAGINTLEWGERKEALLHKGLLRLTGSVLESPLVMEAEAVALMGTNHRRVGKSERTDRSVSGYRP